MCLFSKEKNSFSIALLTQTLKKLMCIMHSCVMQSANGIYTSKINYFFEQRKPLHQKYILLRKIL